MAPPATTLIAIVGLPFAGAAVVPLLYRVVGEDVAYVAAGIAAVCLGLVGTLFGTHGTASIPWIPALDVAVRFYVDGLALLIGTLASGVGVLVLTYSRGYMHAEPGKAKYYATMLAFMGSMLGVAFAGDLIALFVFWELTSLSSFLLIGHYSREDDSQYAARKSMLITVAGGLFLLVGFVLLHAVSGAALGEATWSLPAMLDRADAVRTALRERGLFVPVLLLLGVGAAAKSAQVPLHLWLPNAMEAPTPVSAFLHSATMVKAGVYLVGRFRPLLSGESWAGLFVVLGLTTMTVTAVLAIAATDIKELLAYSTASHLGLITAGFGFNSYIGAETGAFHVLNHALFKAALFLVAGIVAHEAGTRDLTELGGLREDLPITAGVAGIAALGMAGVPPFNGFFSKELLFKAAYHAADEAVAAGGSAAWWALPAVAVIGSVFTFLYSIRFLAMFFGEKPDELGEVHRPPTTMLAPPATLAVLALVVGLRPQLAVDAIVGSAFEAVGGPTPGHPEMQVSYPTHLSPALGMSAATIGLGIVAYPYYATLRRGVRSLLSAGPLTVDWYYDNGVAKLNAVGNVAGRTVAAYPLRTYATWVAWSFAGLTLAAYAATTVTIPTEIALTGAVTVPVVLVLALACIGALAVARAPSHIAGVLTLSIVGFMVAIFYILASAPDLALTQLAVETLVLVIFLLVLDKLPAFYGEIAPRRAARDAVLSATVGVTVFVTVLVSTAATPDQEIATYFLRQSVPKGGGHNVVNVILVDFRAFDTMGEISVIAMAAVSVLTLLVMRERGETS